MTDQIEPKPGEFSFRDPKTLQPHPMSAYLYLNGRNTWSTDAKQMTPLEASNEIMEKTYVGDIQDSISRDGIRVPLVITPEGIIISGCRRWKVARRLSLAQVPVEIKSFENEAEEKQAILDYNRYRVKTLSQTMREAELIKEIAGSRAKKKMLAGRRDLTLHSGEGLPVNRHDRETAAVVGSHIGMGKDKYRKVEQIWNKAKEGNQKAIELVEKLDEKTTSVDAAFNTLKKDDDHLNSPPLSKWQKGEPIGDGPICTCLHCGKTYRLIHSQSGKHRLMETGEPDNSKAPTPDAH